MPFLRKPKISFTRLPLPNKKTKYTLLFSYSISASPHLAKKIIAKKRYVFNDNCLLFSAKYNYSNVLCLWAKCGHQTLFTHKAKNLSFEMFLQRVLQKQKNIWWKFDHNFLSASENGAWKSRKSKYAVQHPTGAMKYTENCLHKILTLFIFGHEREAYGKLERVCNYGVCINAMASDAASPKKKSLIFGRVWCCTKVQIFALGMLAMHQNLFCN